MQRAKKLMAGVLCTLFTVAHIGAVSGLLGGPDALKKTSPYQGGWAEPDDK